MLDAGERQVPSSEDGGEISGKSNQNLIGRWLDSRYLVQSTYPQQNRGIGRISIINLLKIYRIFNF